MAFNHYAKIKRILAEQASGWYIVRIDKPTKAQNLKSDIVELDHYYRIYSSTDEPIRYCKFQQLERLASILEVPTESLPVVSVN